MLNHGIYSPKRYEATLDVLLPNRFTEQMTVACIIIPNPKIYVYHLSGNGLPQESRTAQKIQNDAET